MLAGKYFVNFVPFVLAEEAMEMGDDPEGDGGDEGGGRNSQYPGPDDAAGDTPLNC